VALGCGPAAKAPPPAQRLAPANVETPPGVALVAACTPTGPENCKDAIDDNCNGVIDEGCGAHTGVLQFIIAWGDTTKAQNGGADVDLSLLAPSHEKLQTQDQNRSTPSGFHLDRDCPTDGCGGQNVENVWFDGAEPPRGHYTFEVHLVDLRSADSPVKVRLGVRVGGRTYGADVLLSPADDKKTFGFDL
jgi:tRNA (guanosine-2'-O-)-methyltransferase